MSTSPQSTQVNAAPVSQNVTTLGLGYAIAVSFAFLLLLSTILIASYICCRRSSRHRNTTTTTSADSTAGAGAIVSRFVFIDDDEDDETGVNAVVGLDQAVINSYPKFPFSKSTSRSNSNSESNADSSCCAICLCDYREAEMLRMMPDCKHFFHLHCLDAWLRLNGSCPVCRNSPLPTPMSTPLVEVVPLAQYAAGRSSSRTTRSSSN